MVQEDVLAQNVPTELSTTMTAAAAPPGTMIEISARIQTLEQRQKWLLAGLALCAMLSIAWPVLVSVLLPRVKSQFFSPRSSQPTEQKSEPARQPQPPAKFVAPAEYGALFGSARE